MNFLRSFIAVSLLSAVFVLPLSGSQDRVVKAVALAASGEQARAIRLLKRLAGDADRETRAAARLALCSFQADAGERLRQLDRLGAEFPGLESGRQAILEAGVLLARLKRYGEAEARFRKVIAAGGRLVPQARLQLGICREQAGRLQQAADDLAKIPFTKNNPEIWARAQLVLAGIDIKQNRQEAASRKLLLIIQQAPKVYLLSAVYQLLGDLAYHDKEYRLAWDYFRKLVTRYPRSFEASLARSKLLLLNRRFGNGTQRIWEVQVAVFRRSGNASVQLQLMERQGWKNCYIYPYKIKQHTWYSVRLGPYTNRQRALDDLSRLKQRGMDGFVRTRTVDE